MVSLILSLLIYVLFDLYVIFEINLLYKNEFHPLEDQIKSNCNRRHLIGN